MSSIIPNSTPTPNFYYDQIEHLLTPDEWKVLTYAVRRIFGFEKNRDSTYATISLSTFENGVTYQDKETGEVIRLSYGCGISRPRISACLSSLVKFGILRRGRNTKDGRVWRLETDENKIDFDGLWTRFNAQQEAAVKRVAKAAQASADKRRKQDTSTTDVLGEEVRQSYPQEYDSPTTTGKAVVPTESNEKATGKQDSLAESAPEQPPTPSKKNKASAVKKAVPRAQLNPMIDALVAAFHLDPERLTEKRWSSLRGEARQLCLAGYGPEIVALTYALCKLRKYENFTEAAITKYANDADQVRQQQQHAAAFTPTLDYEPAEPDPRDYLRIPVYEPLGAPA